MRIFIVNHEAKMIHIGVRDGESTKLDPRCNIPTARSEGAEGTETVAVVLLAVTYARFYSVDAALDLINGGYAWCSWCRE